MADSLRNGIFLLVLMAVGSPAVAQSPILEAVVDRTVVEADGTVHLTITTSEGDSDVSPDLSPLKKDFDLGTSQKSQTTVIEGKEALSTSWVVTLAPKGLGELVIPSIKVGQHKTKPITISVIAPEQAGSGSGLVGQAENP